MVCADVPLKLMVLDVPGIISPPVIDPPTLSVPVPEIEMIFLGALAPIVMFPVTVNVPVVTVTEFILESLLELLDINELQIRAPDVITIFFVRVVTIGGLIVTAPLTFSVKPFT